MRIKAAMSEGTRFVTAEELERLPDDDHRYELVDGRLIRMSPVGVRHGWVVSRLMFRLMQHLQDRPDGVVFTEVGFKLSSKPDNVRAPDISFVRRERLPATDLPGFYAGPPDVAIEVLSPSDAPSYLREKVERYLSAGVRLVVVIDPDERSATSYRAHRAAVRRRHDGEAIDVAEIPGFECTVGELFDDI
jgi:Uma2 family endonuclease